MKLLLLRNRSSAVSTIGRLHINGNEFCFTCEDVVRPDGEKVAGKTAIPAGLYRVALTHSPRFSRILPLIYNTERDGACFVEHAGVSFSGVRIHPGNTAADTDGCILPGMGYQDDAVTQSVVAFNALMLRLEAAEKAGDAITLEIRNSDIGGGR